MILAFQFHKGTIRTWLGIILSRVTAKFQFHKGTIRTNEKGAEMKPPFYFNSIKVRLEPKAGYIIG